jgi:hypothetical protein
MRMSVVDPDETEFQPGLLGSERTPDSPPDP